MVGLAWPEHGRGKNVCEAIPAQGLCFCMSGATAPLEEAAETQPAPHHSPELGPTGASGLAPSNAPSHRGSAGWEDTQPVSAPKACPQDSEMAPSWKATQSRASAATGRSWKSDGSGYLAPVHCGGRDWLNLSWLHHRRLPKRWAAQTGWLPSPLHGSSAQHLLTYVPTTCLAGPTPQVPGSGPPRTLSSWVRASYI